MSSLSEVSPIERRDRSRVVGKPEIMLDLEDRDWNYNVESGMSHLHTWYHPLLMCVGALQRIIMNLAGNAQKFTNHGHIIISMRIANPVAEVSSEGQSPTLILRIKDTGKGISPEFMERKLYSPFSQEDSFVPGVGLGLSIV
jgi:signal transduction histidine kinase